MKLTNKKISVIVPCYNEEANILPMYERLTKTLINITDNYEIIYTDNASLDNSEKIFRELVKNDNRVKVILFSRNFGSSDVGFTAGSELATGDAIVWIDGDQQDPPELIEKFALKWQDGFDIVYGIRKRRKGNIALRTAYKIFYRILKKISYIDIPLDAGDFSLIDSKVIKVINSMPERDRFMRGLRAWAGFKHTGIEYTRDERKGGVTSLNLLQYLRMAKRGVFSFSYIPLEWISYLAGLVVLVSFLAIVFYLVGYLFLPRPQGIPTIIILVLFLGGIQLLSLSVIGEYLGKIFEEVKNRPKYVIKEIIGGPF